MEKVTAIIISFLRPAYTKACVKSLRKMYPDIKIIVGENGEYDKELAKVCKQADAKYIDLPFDSGVCVGRNTLISHVETEFVLIGDDDFLYTKEAMVDKMWQFLNGHPEFDLIGGRVSLGGVLQNYQGHIEKHARHFITTAIDLKDDFYKDEASGLRYCPADLTFNYFVGRTEKIKATPWDDQIKVAYEHFSWFFDFKLAGGKVAFSPDPVVVHKPVGVFNELIKDPNYGKYSDYRNRKSDRERFFAKYELDYTIGMNGKKAYAPGHTSEAKKSDIKHVDFCITTFKRPKALERLLYSIAEFYSQANVYVADQNEHFDRPFYKDLRTRLQKAGLVKRVSFERLPYDCGLSYARNHLVRTTPNKYKLILDDDMIFTAETDIGKMVKLLEAHPRVAVVGGRLQQLGTDIHFEFNLENKDGVIRQIPDGQPMRDFNGIGYKRTGCVLNFALMRKDLFNLILWDQDLKVTEHMDFYLRMRSVAYDILYTPDVVIDHPPTERDPDYKELRQRSEFIVKMMRKHGAKKIVSINGQVTELTDSGEIKRYKEVSN